MHTTQDFKSAFAALPPESQARFLATVSYEATVWARHHYPEVADNAKLSLQVLRAFNELQHKLTAQVVHLLAGDEGRYPDDVFVDIMFECAEMAKCEAKLSQVFQRLVLSESNAEGQ